MPFRAAAPLVAALLCPVDLDAQRFADWSDRSNINFRHQASKTPRKYLPETMGGGVALIDYDGDGLLDVFFVNGAQLSLPQPDGHEPDKSDPRFWNRMYRNLGGMRFEDVTERLGLQGRGYGMGAAVADYDGDGDPDLLVTAVGTGAVPAARLYRNEGGERFVEQTEASGLNATGWATSAGFFDADNDGDLDLFLARYMEWSFEQDNRCGLETTYGRTYCHPDLFKPVPNLFFLSNGDGTFADATDASGIGDSPSKGLGVAFADFDKDGFADVIVANDSHPQFFFHNQGDGTFVEDALFSGLALDEDGREFAGMGVAAADLDGDGFTDLVVTTLSQQKYAVFYNTGGAVFDYRTRSSNVGRITQLFSGWGVAAEDFDNDGRRDLFFANGHVMDNIERSQPTLRYAQPPLLLRGREDSGFTDVSADAGNFFAKARAGRGAAVGDLDNDGRLDIVGIELDGPAFVAGNVSAADHGWIGVALRGCGANRDGTGARVAVSDDSGRKRYATVGRAGSYLSSSDPRAFFGLGERKPASLLVAWPGGIEQEVEAVEPNRIIDVRQPCGP